MTRRQCGCIVLAFLTLSVTAVAILTTAEAQTVTIEGMVVGEAGQPLANVSVNAQDTAVPGVGGNYVIGTLSDGTFSLAVPPALYWVRARPSAPRLPISVRVDARGGSVAGLVLRTSSAPLSSIPDVPPRASLIHITPPDADGDVTVTGAPGSVPASAAVYLVTLDTGHLVLAQAATDGSFTGSTFAPPGRSLQIKADPFLVNYAGVFDRGVNPETLALELAPSTILRIPDPPATGSGVPFAGAGHAHHAESGSSPLPAWTTEGTISTQRLNPGGTLRVQGTLRIHSPALQSAGPMGTTAQLTLEQLSGPDGSARLERNFLASVFTTPTGLPIERQPQNSNAIEQLATPTLSKVAPDRAEAVFDLLLQIPSSLSAGYYRPVLSFSFQGVPLESPPERWVVAVFGSQVAGSGMYLPIVRIGDPAPPRLSWMLLGDTSSNGTRGTRAIEDRERFGLASRILTQSETFIVPRLDPASGQVLTYRLEPFAPTVSLGIGEAPPTVPLIPFRFPSGSLTVRITKPDGSIQVLGPAAFAQDRQKSLTSKDGGLLDLGGGHISHLYELSTMDPRFEVQFTQDGRHVITVDGSIEDIWGNTWRGTGRYEVHVARWLSVDTAVLPGTPFEVGNAFNPGVITSPAVPADVTVRFRLAPNSDAGQMIDQTVSGRANRFGYFHPLTTSIPLGQPGEYRVDVTASFVDDHGFLWMGSRTWGGVVAPLSPAIVAHGRRGVREGPNLVSLQWFFRADTGFSIGGGQVFFPFNSGDITWEQKSDAASPNISFQDPGGLFVPLLRARAGGVPMDTGSFDERAAVGEVPLFSSRPDGLDPYFDPSKVDLWGYSYRAVERPLVRIREEISEDWNPGAYWRFGEGYAGQPPRAGRARFRGMGKIAHRQGARGRL